MRGIVQRFTRSQRLRLFLGYDGTLADADGRPVDAVRSPVVQRALERVAQAENIHVTIIGRRRLQDLRALAGMPGIHLAGCCGVEISGPDGTVSHRADAEALRVLDGVRAPLAELLRHEESLYLEDKGCTLAVSGGVAVDFATDRTVLAVRALFEQAAAASPLRVLRDERLLELGPLQMHKGDAVAHLLEAVQAEPSDLLYIGGSASDEEAFPVVHSHGGVCVRVGPANLRTDADFILCRPGTVHTLLSALAAVVGSRPIAAASPLAAS